MSNGTCLVVKALARAAPHALCCRLSHLHLHVLTSTLTEARKQAQAEAEYYETFKDQQEDSEQRHDSTVSALLPHTSVPEPVLHSANRTPRSCSPVKDLDTLIARIATERRGSDDSLKTAYAADDIVPESAYRSRSDIRPALPAQQISIAAPVPVDNSPDQEDLISTFTDY